MDKKIRIGLMGALTNSSNLGCLALTYSALLMLEEIEEEYNYNFTYILFENNKKTEHYKRICKELRISDQKFIVAPIARTHSKAACVKNIFRNIDSLISIKKCDVVIDFTQGDSFTDIYGQNRFETLCNMKQMVIDSNIPLILAPQTYGPFKDTDNEIRAKRIINQAKLVIARDTLSAQCIKNLTDKTVDVTTDIAFKLPVNKSKEEKKDRIKVGVNVSGLLVSEKTEATEINFKLNTNYERFVDSILKYLTSNPQYEVYLIPHVGDDGISEVSKKYPELKAFSRFSSPIEAKNVIARMDIFIGARMHATIAAVSSAVATIPTAYSRKFQGLFETMGYNYVIDLQKLTTDDAIRTCIDYINRYRELENKALECAEYNKIKINDTKVLLGDCIKDSVD